MGFLQGVFNLYAVFLAYPSPPRIPESFVSLEDLVFYRLIIPKARGSLFNLWGLSNRESIRNYGGRGNSLFSKNSVDVQIVPGWTQFILWINMLECGCSL